MERTVKPVLLASAQHNSAKTMDKPNIGFLKLTTQCHTQKSAMGNKHYSLASACHKSTYWLRILKVNVLASRSKTTLVTL